MSYYQFCSN